MMSVTERMQKILTAPAAVLARLDAILTGEDSQTAVFKDRDSRTFTITETAKRLNVSRPSVYGLIRRGCLKTVSFGTTKRITSQSIMDFASGRGQA